MIHSALKSMNLNKAIQAWEEGSFPGETCSK